MTMHATVKLDWTPPPGMTPRLAADWRAFFRAAVRTYGVTPQYYRDMYVAQHGTCYICRKANGKNPDDPMGRGGKRLGIDHNHVTGAVRGLLCTAGPGAKVPGCNWIIGTLSGPALSRALAYVETEPGQTVLNARQQVLSVEAASGEPFPDPDGFLSTVLGLK
jgi:hypothetical protein